MHRISLALHRAQRFPIVVSAIVLAISIACALAPSIANSGDGPGSQWTDDTAPAPKGKSVDFTLKDLKGKPLHLHDLRGHPVIVDFWATWCPPCRKQIPELESIYKHYQSQGLMVVGVSCDTVKGDGARAVGPFIKDFRITYPILLADEALLDKLDLDVLPTTLFVDRNGHLVSRMLGAGRIGELSDSARELMAR